LYVCHARTFLGYDFLIPVPGICCVPVHPQGAGFVFFSCTLFLLQCVFTNVLRTPVLIAFPSQNKAFVSLVGKGELDPGEVLSSPMRLQLLSQIWITVDASCTLY
jgi:hypothetical protein